MHCNVVIMNMMMMVMTMMMTMMMTTHKVLMWSTTRCQSEKAISAEPRKGIYVFATTEWKLPLHEITRYDYFPNILQLESARLRPDYLSLTCTNQNALWYGMAKVSVRIKDLQEVWSKCLGVFECFSKSAPCINFHFLKRRIIQIKLKFLRRCQCLSTSTGISS